MALACGPSFSRFFPIKCTDENIYFAIKNVMFPTTDFLNGHLFTIVYVYMIFFVAL